MFICTKILLPGGVGGGRGGAGRGHCDIWGRMIWAWRKIDERK